MLHDLDNESKMETKKYQHLVSQCRIRMKRGEVTAFLTTLASSINGKNEEETIVLSP